MRTLLIVFSSSVLLMLFTCQGCKTGQVGETIKLSKNHTVVFLNQAAAGKAINTDQEDRYFELVQPIEISVQMHKPLNELPTDRAALINNYREFLKNDVTNFSPQERKRIDLVMKEIFKTCDAVAPGLFPERIRLIKTFGKHYGDGVYYTREDCIVIPQDVLDGDLSTDFTNTMYHEVWHIVSRYHPKLQKAAYELIGFMPQPTSTLQIPARLKEHILYNPDGIDMNWQIKLTKKDEPGAPITCMPVLFTKADGYTDKQPSFFNYVEFNLYPIKDGRLVTTSDSLSSPINLRDEPSFFKQITDNTNYIIHPDEVIADNFMFIMTTSQDVMKRQRFSKEGNELLKQMERLLKTVR